MLYTGTVQCSILGVHPIQTNARSGRNFDRRPSPYSYLLPYTFIYILYCTYSQDKHGQLGRDKAELVL